MKKILLNLLVLVLTVVIPQGGYAYTTGAAWTWNAGDPNYNSAVTPNTGTIDTTGFVFGNFLGASANQANSVGWGDSGVSVGWDDSYIAWVGDANTNGDALDGLWVWVINDPISGQYHDGWWDLGKPFNRIAVFTSQDHGPYLAEGLEFMVFGTNTLWDNNALSPQASIIAVYLDGWRAHTDSEDQNSNGWLSDDISATLQLDNAYRYIKIAAWSDKREFNEPEIDAVAGIEPIPEPGTIILMCSGLICLVTAFRVKKKTCID